MIVTQSFESALNRAGNPLVIGGYVYEQKNNAGVATGSLSVGRPLLGTDAELNTGSGAGYLSISQVSKGAFNLNALSIDTDLAVLNRTYFVGYRDGVAVVSGSSTDLLSIGILGDTRYSFGSNWENLTEVRIFNAAVLDVSLGRLGFAIDDVTTTDVTLPGAPTLVAPAPATSDTTPTLTGVAEVGSTVTIFNGTTQLATVVADANGQYTFTPGTPLADGTYSLTARATDPSGNIGTASAAVILQIDTLPPAAPILTAGAGLTRDSTPTIAGRAEPGATIILASGPTQLGVTAADSNGDFSFTPTTALGEGTYVVTARAVDAAGNLSGTSASISVRIDTVPPGVPVVNAFSGPVNDTTPTITGTADAGSVVTISNGAAVLGTAVAGGNGTFTFTPTAGLSGTLSLTATAQDAAGNVSAPSGAVSLTIDTTLPATPAITTVPGATNDTTPTIAGIADAGALVNILANGIVLGTAVAGPNGAFAFTPSLALADGTTSFTAVARDAAGNLSAASGPVLVTIDTVAPGAPALDAFAGPTRDTTPTITGQAEAGTTVVVSSGSNVLGSAVADGAGNFSLTPTTALPEGTAALRAVAIDAAGNVSPATAITLLVIDTTPPGAPVLDVPSPTNDPTPTITGSAEAGTSVTILSGATVLGTVLTGPDGSFTLTPSIALPPGTANLTAIARDPAGNNSPVSAGVTVVIDPTVPSAPVLDVPAPTNDTTPAITGSAEAGATVTISNGATPIGSVVAGLDGRFSLTPATALPEGTAILTAVAVDIAGNASPASAPASLIIDLTAPGAPAFDLLVASATATPTLTGFSEAGATVTLLDDGTVLGTTVADVNGRFSFTPTAPLASGINLLTASATDAAGNVGALSAPVPLLITAPPSGGGDVTAPDAPVLDALARTNDVTPVITGSAEPGTTVTVSNGTTPIGSVIAAPDGTFRLTPAVLLPEGTASLTAVARDAAGNVSPASAIADLVIDLTAPGAPVFDVLAPTNDTTPTLTGLAEADATVTILDNGTVLGTAVTGPDGRFSFTPSAPLAAGINVLTATATDAAGNVSTASPGFLLTIDPVGPGAPVLAVFPDPTNDTTPTISGTAEAGATVTVLGNGFLLGTALAGPDGSFSLTPGTPLAPGGNILMATATDVAGNVSAVSAGVSLTIDVTPPAAPVLNALAPTSDVTPTITGAAEAGTVVTVSNGATVLGTTVAGPDGSFSLTPGAALPAGIATFTAVARDAAGNDSLVSAGISVLIDPSAPSAPVFDALAPTNLTTPAITGAAEPGTTIIVSNGATQIGSVVTGPDGRFSLTPVSALPEGTTSLTAVAVDVAGNASPASAPASLVIDLTIPGSPALDALAPTRDATPTLTGSAEPGATVTILDSGIALGTGLAGADGRFSITPTTPLADGTASLTVIAQDAAGNISAPSTAVALVIDTTPPAAPIITLPSGTTGSATPPITGTAEVGTIVSVSNGADVLGSVVVGLDGLFSLTPSTALPQGTASLTAVAVDAAGNASPVSTPATLVVDLTAPGTPVFDLPGQPGAPADATTDDATPTFTGTAEPGSTVSITVDTPEGPTVVSTVSGSDGAWRLDLPPLADGQYTVVASATDAAGNRSVPSAPFALTIDTQAGGNLAPVALADTNATAARAAAVAGNVLANDSDPNVGDALHVTAIRFSNGVTVDVPATGTATVTSDYGTLQIAADGHYRYQAIGSNNLDSKVQGVTETFTYTVSDGTGLSSSAALSLALRGSAPGAEASFGFAFTEARVGLVGEAFVLTGPDGARHDISGVGTLTFTDGTIQENDGHALVDDVWYLSQNLDVWRAQIDADTHYRLFGWQEGRDPNAYFQTLEYLAQNGDVAAAGINPLEHYAVYGEAEGRSPGQNFSADAYLALNPDVKAAGLNALDHYLQYGVGEGRSVVKGEVSASQIGDFDAAFYLGQNADVAAFARAVPSVQSENVAFRHYLEYGASEGRAPNALFDPAAYLAANPDVAAAGLNPLIHYQEYGWHEGRDPGPGFSTNGYLEANPDVAAAGFDPLQHFLEYGMKEGRLPV